MRQGPALLTVILACLSGCQTTGPETTLSSIDGCGSSAECPTDLKCLARTCTSSIPPSWPIRLELAPNQRSSSAHAEINDVRFDSSPVLRIPDVSLPEYSEFSGVAQLANGQSLAVEATARMLTSSESPATYRSESLEDVTGARFIMSLPIMTPTITDSLRALVYELTVQPKEADRYPPWRVAPFQPPDDGGRVFFDLPSSDTMTSVSGVVLLSELYPTPVSGLTVFAIDEQSQTVSSTGRTDANGRFTIYFWPGSSGQLVTLRLRRSALSGPMPDLRLNYTLAQPGQENPDVSLTMGDIGTLERHFGTVMGTEPIGGATLRFLASIGNGRYRVDVRTTDSEGKFEVALYPGNYEVDVIPPLTSRYRISRVPLEVIPGQSIELRPQRRILVSGTVVDPDGAGLNGARIYANLRTPFFAGPELNRPNETVVSRGQYVQTGQRGNFVLQLDPGEHQLTVTPPISSGLAIVNVPLNVPALDTTISGLDISLPPAAAINFRVINTDDEPIEGVRVHAYRTDTTPPSWLGQAWSDAQGEVLLRLPNTESR